MIAVEENIQALVKKKSTGIQNKQYGDVYSWGKDGHQTVSNTLKLKATDRDKNEHLIKMKMNELITSGQKILKELSS